jgi:hypothetical protein
VSQLLYDQTKVASYRKAATELHELRVVKAQEIESAIVSGNKTLASGALEELKAKGAEFQKLRETLTARDLFVAKYNIEVHGDHKVSFVLPKGVSRFEMLSEGQRLVEGRDLVNPSRLVKWQSDPAFQKLCDVPKRIQINARVQGGDGQDRASKEKLVVETLKLTLPSLEDLAAAFVAHYVAMGEPLFGWYNKASQWSFLVRAAGGALVFNSRGLRVRDIADDSSFSDMAVAALVPRN